MPIPRPELFQEVKHHSYYMVNLITLTDIEQLTAILEKSYKKPQVLFKHSTGFIVSGVALKRMENAGITPDADFYFIDLAGFRKYRIKLPNILPYLMNLLRFC
jgi:hypothetical protein